MGVIRSELWSPDASTGIRFKVKHGTETKSGSHHMTSYDSHLTVNYTRQLQSSDTTKTLNVVANYYEISDTI